MTDVLPFDVPDVRAQVTDQTTAILRLLYGDPVHATDRARIVSAIVYCAAHSGGWVDTNKVRARLSDPDSGQLTVYPPVLGSVFRVLTTLGVLRFEGWDTNSDRKGRNAGKPQPLRRLVRDGWAA
jgi:hypothetical protein